MPSGSPGTGASCSVSSMAMPSTWITWTTTRRLAMRMKNPPHPGRIVREDCLPELNLTIGKAAEALGVSRQTLDKIVNERGSVTPDM
ncbi:MAG: HigA family addiction module antidote protein, partial [Pseudolabrys sp.]|nr:HigA family addiction module antidote protein [Pseudolabrys sp.]